MIGVIWKGYQKTPADNYDISLGIGIGELRFGMSETKVNLLLGKPDKKINRDGILKKIFFEQRLLLQSEEDKNGWAGLSVITPTALYLDKIFLVKITQTKPIISG